MHVQQLVSLASHPSCWLLQPHEAYTSANKPPLQTSNNAPASISSMPRLREWKSRRLMNTASPSKAANRQGIGMQHTIRFLFSFIFSIFSFFQFFSIGTQTWCQATACPISVWPRYHTNNLGKRISSVGGILSTATRNRSSSYYAGNCVLFYRNALSVRTTRTGLQNWWPRIFAHQQALKPTAIYKLSVSSYELVASFVVHYIIPSRYSCSAGCEDGLCAGKVGPYSKASLLIPYFLWGRNPIVKSGYIVQRKAHEITRSRKCQLMVTSHRWFC